MHADLSNLLKQVSLLIVNAYVTEGTDGTYNMVVSDKRVEDLDAALKALTNLSAFALAHGETGDSVCASKAKRILQYELLNKQVFDNSATKINLTTVLSKNDVGSVPEDTHVQTPASIARVGTSWRVELYPDTTYAITGEGETPRAAIAAALRKASTTGCD